jgi:hypothetical protein
MLKSMRERNCLLLYSKLNINPIHILYSAQVEKEEGSSISYMQFQEPANNKAPASFLKKCCFCLYSSVSQQLPNNKQKKK